MAHARGGSHNVIVLNAQISIHVSDIIKVGIKTLTMSHFPYTHKESIDTSCDVHSGRPLGRPVMHLTCSVTDEISIASLIMC